jgi:hypothetical protein
VASLKQTVYFPPFCEDDVVAAEYLLNRLIRLKVISFSGDEHGLIRHQLQQYIRGAASRRAVLALP